MKKKRNMKTMITVIILLFIITLEHKFLFELQSVEKGKKENIVSDEFSYTMEIFDTIFEEMKCFPVKKDSENEPYPVTYEDSFGSERTYGGKRQHEGCDLMAIQNIRGKYTICSMTSGVVENIGWLEQGGWRIGIRSDNDIYYYYAHLDSYEKAFEVGERIEAGQILGRMGDSGYGKEPDTKGNFDVHLHLGIYVKDIRGMEHAVNPYWYLKQLEK